MFDEFRLLADWFAREPSASLMMFATATLLFASTVSRYRKDPLRDLRFGTSLIRGLIYGILLIGIIGIFYILLESAHNTLKSSSTSLVQREESRKEYIEVTGDWGGPIFQGYLSVTQTFSWEEIREVPGPDNSIRYINQSIVETVDQESITGFNGRVDLRVKNSELGTYELDAIYEYEVVNQSEVETVARFDFPIETGRIFRDLVITVDGEDLASNKQIGGSRVQWEQTVQPHQKLVVVISFSTQGMNSFAFNLMEKRPIQNFVLTVDVDSPDVDSFTQPDTTAILVTEKSVAHGMQTSWEIKNSIIAPYIGIILRTKTDTDIHTDMIIRVLRYMPRGLMLLIIVVVFTHLLCGIPIDLWRLTLFAAAFSGIFLMLMGFAMLGIDQLIILPMLVLPAMFLVRMIYRILPRLPLILIVSITLIFMVGYPFAGLIPDGPQRTAFDSLAQSLVILYVFVLAFYTRVRRKNTTASG